MDRATVDVYEARAPEWRERRGAFPKDELGRAFREEVGDGPIADLGCGVGRYLAQLGRQGFGLDATAAMLELANEHGRPLVRGDLESLPFATAALAGAFARHSYLHLPKERFVPAMAEARRVLRPGGRVLATLIEGRFEGRNLPDDDFPGRYFTFWTAETATAALAAAGFENITVTHLQRDHGSPDLLVRAAAPE